MTTWAGGSPPKGETKMSKTFARLLVVLLSLTLFAAACGDSEDDASDSDDGGSAATQEDIDYAAIGLWDDGPCDESKPPLKLGLMTVFESPVLSLKDQADAFEASAAASRASAWSPREIAGDSKVVMRPTTSGSAASSHGPSSQRPMAS